MIFILSKNAYGHKRLVFANLSLISVYSQACDSQIFPTYNDKRHKHAQLYKNYTEDYGHLK
uniref:Uncharacterized protein n=1 Tax=Romanomermis culicivorax TaxID=13658 RepID=A0A915JM17_ROMCU